MTGYGVYDRGVHCGNYGDVWYLSSCSSLLWRSQSVPGHWRSCLITAYSPSRHGTGAGFSYNGDLFPKRPFGALLLVFGAFFDMKFMRPCFSFLLLSLLLAGCASAPRAPANNPQAVVPPVLEPSVISVPVIVDLEQLRTEVLKQLPSPVLAGKQTQLLRVRFNPAEQSREPEPGSCSITALNCLTRKAGKSLAVDYTAPVETVINHQVFVRDLAMNMTGNQFTVSAQVEFTVNTRIKSSLAQFGIASCGIREAMPRVEFSLTGTVGWTANGDIQFTPASKANPYELKWLRPCAITALQLDVETLLAFPVLREKLQESIRAALADGLRQASIKTQLARAWPELNAPRELQPNVWLLPHPEKVSFADPVGTGRYVNTGVLVRALPEIVSGPKPVLPLPPVPVPERGINGDAVHLAVKGDIALADADRLLNQKLAGKPWLVGGHEVLIEAIRLYGNEDNAVIGLTLKKPVRAEIFVVGKPVFDAEKNEVHFENLNYSLGSRDFLVKSANWLLGSSFREALQQKARFRFDEDLGDSLKQFKDYQMDVGPGLKLRGSISRIRPQALYFTQDRLQAYVLVDGHLQLEMKGK